MISKGTSSGTKKKKALPSTTVDSKAPPDTLETGKPKIDQWADKPESAAYEAATKLYNKIEACYRNQEEQADRISEFWNIFNAIPDENQVYSGNSQAYVPAVRDAINARAKRQLKQLFPASHRHVDAISADAEIPYTQLSLLEHYIRKTRLKDTVRSCLIAGDVTGQWNLYIDWTKSYRRVTGIVQRNPILKQIEGESVEDIGLDDPLGDDEEALESEDVVEEGPEIVDFATEDLAVLPPTAQSIEKAQATSLKLRMSQEKFEQMVDEGVFVLPEGYDSAEDFFKGKAQPSKGIGNRKDPAKQAVHGAGIKTEGTTKFALIYEVCTKVDLDGDAKEPAMIYYAGENDIVGIIRQPYWGGKRPIISEAVDRRQGSFFGRSKVEPVKYLQWNLTDFFNMGQDSAMYSLLPVFAADPAKNPNWASMVIGLAAVWPIAPGDLKPVEFPQLYKDSMAMCGAIKAQIFESMDVNDAMFGKMPQGRKNNAVISQQQQEQATNISDAASRFEAVMLDPLMERLFEYDQQFRTTSILIKSRGEIGVKASMIEVPPQQYGEKYFFQWQGTEAINGQQRLQTQLAWVNILKGIPPALLDGRRLSLVPMLEAGTEMVFGPELGSKILIDERNQFTIPPEVEDELLHNGLPVEVHEADDDTKHLQDHMRAASLTGDPAGLFKAHLVAHGQQIQRKRQMQMSQQQPGVPGSPGGAGQPGAAGTPRPGAVPAGPPKGPQQPPGMVHPDSVMDPMAQGRG
jgi:hypothetical protein